MSSKKEETSIEQAQKEAEMIGEFAKDAKNRKDARTLSNKLESAIEDQHDEKHADRNKTNLTSALERQEHVIEKTLDGTKDNIRKSLTDARKEIPQYTEAVKDYQEQTIQTIREIVDNYIESQKEIFSIYQSVWTPFIENANSRYWNYWSISPKGIAETYGRIASSFADDVISATRLANNTISANMELISTAMQQIKDNSKEYIKIGVNAIKAFNDATNDIATSNSYSMESARNIR